jgi:dTDP-4-dehydrorhamnose reductase
VLRQAPPDRHTRNGKEAKVQRVLVTGVNDMLGSNIARTLSDRCDVLGCYYRSAVEFSMFSTLAWNPTDTISVAEILDSWRPQWVIHCPSLAASSWDNGNSKTESHAEPAIAAELATAATFRGIPLTVVTSDAIFRGPRMFHDEGSMMQGTSEVAQMCLQLEKALANTAALVVRTHAFGWSSEECLPCFAEQAYDCLRRGQSPPLAGRRYATPILASDLANLLWHAQSVRLQGILHLAGAERTSMHRFVRELATCLGLPCPSPNVVSGDSDWQEETSLSSRRARRILARPLPMLRDGIERFLAQAGRQSRPSWCINSRRKPLEAAA